MLVGRQKVECAIIQMLFPHMLKIVNIGTVSSWQEELFIPSTSDNPTDMQNPEPAEIFSIMLLHSTCPSFTHPRMCVELECGAENSPNFPLAESRLSEQACPLSPLPVLAAPAL